MKAAKFIMLALLVAAGNCTFAQTGQWNLAGNSLTGTEKLGSTNNKPLNFITNKKIRLTLTSNGNLNFTSDTSSIQFALPGTNPKPMMFMFPSGTENTRRMIIAHSPAFPGFGLSYSDVLDRFDFLSNGSSVFNIDLLANSAGVNGKFDVTGNAHITGNVGVGTPSPEANLHIFRGSAGNVNGFFNAPLVVENSTHNYINMLSPSNAETGILFGSPVNSIDGGVVYNNISTARGLQFRTNGNATRMVISDQGFVGIKTIAPATELHVVHANSGGNATHGLRIENPASGGKHWTFTNFFNGDLIFFAGDLVGGIFDQSSGDYNTPSDLRRKKDIEKAPDVLQKVMQLDIKKYHFLQNKSDDKKHYGMIAQDVEKIFPEVVSHNFFDSGKQDLYTMNYSAFGVIALKAIQEIEKQKQDKDATIDSLKSEINNLKSEINGIKTMLQKGATTGTSSQAIIHTSLANASLEQNIPNPFTSSTAIHYTLPDKFSAAQIIITSKSGSTIKKVSISGSGKGVLNVDASLLTSGIYNYALIADGKMIDSKQFIVAK